MGYFILLLTSLGGVFIGKWLNRNEHLERIDHELERISGELILLSAEVQSNAQTLVAIENICLDIAANFSAC